MFTVREFVHDGVTVKYSTRPARGDRKHLVVIFSGFRRPGTYDFGGSVSAGLRGDILWIQDFFYGENAYYLCSGLDFKIRDTVHALIEHTRISLGLEKSQCTLAGFSKGGSAALYYGLTYGYGAIVSTVPQMHIGSYVHENWPKVFHAMTLTGSRAEREELDRLLPDLVRNDQVSARNIYLISSTADAQYPQEIEPYLELFSKYDNFNFILTDTPMVTEHKMVTRYNVPLILAILAARIDGATPRLGQVRNGSANHRSSLPGPSIADVQSRSELVSGLTAAPIHDGRVFFEGYGFVKGYTANRYGTVSWKINLKAGTNRHSYHGGGITNPELSNEFFEAEYCDYSIASFASMRRKGEKLDELVPGIYGAEIEVSQAGITLTDVLTAPKPIESWGETDSTIVGIQASTRATEIIVKPAIGPDPKDAFFKQETAWVKDAHFHVEGYFAVLGFETPRYSDVAYYLVLVSDHESADRKVIRIASAHRNDVGTRLGDAYGDYSKSYFATPKYQGVDLSAVNPGTYTAYITVRFGRAIFTKQIDSKITVHGCYDNGNKLLSVGVIGSCISRDNFASAVSPNWKQYFSFHGGQYQMSFVSLMADSVEVPDGDFNDLDAHSANATRRDFSKEYLLELEDGGPDVIVLDFLADARYGCLALEGSLVTNNKWKLQKSDFYQKLPERHVLSMDNHYEKYLELFRDAVVRFEKFRTSFMPNTTIILNSARAVEGHIDRNKNVTYPADYIAKLNSRLDVLQDIYLQEFPDTPILDDMMDGVISSMAHPWGPGQVHYEPVFYQRFQRALRGTFGYRVEVAFD